jgi:hypothetical protein
MPAFVMRARQATSEAIQRYARDLDCFGGFAARNDEGGAVFGAILSSIIIPL